MAEERLIDDDKDKDKKYRFRINADGEEELVIEYGEQQEEEGADGAPPVLSPDEDLSVVDGEEVDARFDSGEEGEAVLSLTSMARADMDMGNYSTALEYIEQAKDISPADGTVVALELEIYTRGLSDFPDSILADAVQAAQNVAKYSSEDDKKRLREEGNEKLNSMICALQSQVDELSAQNERGKAERAPAFAAANKKAMLRFFVVFAAFAVALGLAIYFSTVMYVDRSGVNIVLTAVFGAVAFLLFIASAFAARAFNIAARRVRMNRDNRRTRVGRDYEAHRARLIALETIYNAIN